MTPASVPGRSTVQLYCGNINSSREREAGQKLFTRESSNATLFLPFSHLGNIFVRSRCSMPQKFPNACNFGQMGSAEVLREAAFNLTLDLTS